MHSGGNNEVLAEQISGKIIMGPALLRESGTKSKASLSTLKLFKGIFISHLKLGSIGELKT